MAHDPQSGPSEQYQLRIGDRGRLVLPAPLRRRLKLRSGDQLVLTVDSAGDMRLSSLDAQIEKCMGMFADPAGRSLSKELIRERREEARRESRK